MNVFVKILMWAAIILLAAIGVPLLLKSLFGLVGLALLIVRIVVNLAALAFAVAGIAFLWKRIRSSA